MKDTTKQVKFQEEVEKDLLAELKSGIYQLSIAGAVREGNDQLNGKMFEGHIKTEYKIAVR